MTRSPHSTSDIAQLVIRRARAGQRADSEFFTTWSTLERARWRAVEINGLLQIRPSLYFGFRPFVQEFHIAKTIEVARSISLANPQYGPGGGEKLFIRAAEHAAALEPVGELVPLVGPKPERDAAAAAAVGFVKDLIDIEISLGNSVVGSDRQEHLAGRRRFWLQEPLHLAEIRRQLEVPESVRSFEDVDIYGDAAGYVSDSDAQVVVAPVLRKGS